MRLKYARLVTLGCLMLLAVWLSMFTAQPATGQSNPMARLEPTRGAYFGVDLDWASDTASDFNARLGLRAASYVYYVDFPFRPSQEDHLKRFIDQVAGLRGLAVVTLQPQIPVKAITPTVANDLAATLASLDDEAPIFLRFAPEMNGSWHPWGQQPTAYVEAFQAIADAVHAKTAHTAMLWEPNSRDGYPFAGRQYSARQGTPDFTLLDTDRDGALTESDDPYLPYYPGDAAVDWVGLSLYYWGRAYPWGENEASEEGRFLAQVRDFYQTFAKGHDKPLAVETGAFYSPDAGGDSELAVKQAWWRQIFDPQTGEQFPRLKLITWLEWRRPEPEAGGAEIDWTITNDRGLVEAFRADLPGDRIIFGPVTARGFRGMLPFMIWPVFTLFLAIPLFAVAGRMAGLRPQNRDGALADWAYPEQSRGRDLRIDLLRGIAMLFVVVDHIALPSLYHLLSHERIGVVSGAELFVMLSGVVVGMVFGKRAIEQGWRHAASTMVARAGQLYLVAVVVVVTAYVLSLVPGLDARVLTTWTDEATGTVYNLYPGANHLPAFIANVVLLRYGPSEFNIMGLYVVLLIVAPLVLLGLLRHSWKLVLAASWGAYLAHSMFPYRLFPSQFEDPFPLFAWQLLFINGIAAGYYRQNLLNWAPRWQGKMFLVISSLLFLAFLLYTWSNPWSEGSFDVRFRLMPDETFYSIYARYFARESLGIGRVLNTVAVFVVLYTLFTHFWKPIAGAVGWFLIPIGQASLYVFIVHVYLTLLIANIPLFEQGNVLINTLGHTAVLLLILLLVRARFLFRWIPT